MKKILFTILATISATTVFANGGINGKMTKHNCNFVTIFPQIPRGVERSNQ